MKKKNLLKELIVFVALVVLVVVATLVTNSVCNNYHMTIINVSMFYFVAVAGICLFLGYGGTLCFTAMTYLGLGAYTTAFLTTKHGVNPVLAVLVSIVACAVVCYVLGIILLKLNGAFFMFADMGIMYVLTNIFNYFEPFTGGANGIVGIPKLSVFGYKFDNMHKWFPLLLVLSIIVIMMISRIRKTTFGRSLMAIRDDTYAALSLGVDVFMTKVYAYTIAGALAGLSGGLYALHNGVVSATLFSYNVELNLITMTIIGGMQSPIGCFLGAFIINALPETIRFVQQYLRLFYGVLVIVMMIFMPTGLAGFAESIYKKILVLIRKTSKKGETI